MTIQSRPFKALQHASLVLAASLLAAMLMLLVTVAVAVAAAETIDSVTPAATAAPAAEAPVPTEESQATSEEAETQVDSTPPVPPAPVAEEPSETKATAPSVTESIDETVESSPAQQVSKLGEDVRHGSVTEVVAVTDRLPGVRTSPVRNLVDDVAQQAHHLVRRSLPYVLTGLTASPLLHSSPLPIRLLPEATSHPDAAHIPPPPLRSRSSSPQRATWLSPPQLIATPGAAEPGAAASRSLERADDGGAASSSGTGTGATPSHVEADRGGSPAPSGPPLPAPGSPGALAPGSGGPIFIPFAALLALLALVAPAILRRLGRVLDFRPPVPFVCALERPG